MSLRPALAALTLALLAVAGCSGPGTPRVAEPVDTQPPVTGIRCAAIDTAMLGRELGGAFGTPREIQTGSITVCSYGTVTIRVDSASDAAKFAAARAALTANKQKAVEFKGLGDEAFSASLSAAGVTLTTVDARLGGMEILVSAGATVAHEKALVAKLFAALAGPLASPSGTK